MAHPSREPRTGPAIRPAEVARGERLFRARKVDLLEVGPKLTMALVDDRRLFAVVIQDLGRPERMRTGCDCRRKGCGHLHAVMLALAEVLAPVTVDEADAAAGLPDWMRRLTEVAAGPGPSDRTRHRELLEPHYIVDRVRTRTTRRLVLQVLLRGRNGAFRAMPLTASPGDLAEVDRSLQGLLRGASGSWYHTSRQYEIAPDSLPRVLAALAETGRAWIGGFAKGRPRDLVALRIDVDGPFTFRARMEHRADGAAASGWLERGDEELRHPEVQAVLGDTHALVGDRLVRVELGPLPRLARDLLTGGAMRADADSADALVASLLELPGSEQLFQDSLLVADAGRPELRVVLRGDHGFPQHVLCEATFAYGDRVVEVESPLLMPPPAPDAPYLRRDVDLEEDELERLEQLAQGVLEPTGMDGCYLLPRTAWSACVHALVGAGIRVFAEGRPIRSTAGISVSIRSGIDWFDLRADLALSDGGRVPVGPLLAAIRKGERLVELGDGSAAMLEAADVARIETLLALGEPHGDGVRLQRSQAWLLDALLQAQAAQVDADAEYRELRHRLAGFRTVAPRQEPQTFQGELRPYQRQGLGWLHFLRELGLGGCLADDMGLGKTVQVLALLQAVHADADRPSLLVVPRSVLENWQREAQRFAPGLRVLDFHGADRWQRLAELPAGFGAYHLVLTTYGTLRIDIPRLAADGTAWEYAVLDEAQAIENERSLTSRAVRLLRARHRLALTGTPVQNHVGELWALFEFLNPGLLGRSRAFRELLAQGDQRGLGMDPALLQRALAPFLLRRTKAAVLPDLPAKQEQDLVCELEGSQRERYDALRAHYRHELLHGGARLDAKERFMVLEALLRLRQAACHEGLLDARRTAAGSAKLDTLLPMLQEIAESGHQALVFSQFTSFLAIVRQRLDGLGIRYQYLDGRTRKRQEKVDAFQRDPGCTAFLISLKAGGFGLNLTAADYVFLLDPWWNPAAEAQAVDRAHRIGRTGKVTAYRLIARDTVEEKVLALQREKRALVEAVLGENESLLAQLTREDLAALLA